MVANHHYQLHVNTYIHFLHQHVIYMTGSGLNWFWTRTEPSRTGSGRFGSGSGSVHPGGSGFWFWFSKNGLRTELNWTLATLMAAGGQKMVNTSCGTLKLMIGAPAGAAGAGVARVRSVMRHWRRGECSLAWPMQKSLNLSWLGGFSRSANSGPRC